MRIETEINVLRTEFDLKMIACEMLGAVLLLVKKQNDDTYVITAHYPEEIDSN